MIRIGKIFILLCSLWCAASSAFGANIMGDKVTQEDFKRIKADHWRLVGKNIIASGNVYVPFGNFELCADQVVINIESKDLEAVGNLSLQRWITTKASVEPTQLEELSRTTGIRVELIDLSCDIWGNYKANIAVSQPTDRISAHRVTGNLKTRYFSFDDAQLQFRHIVCKAKSGEHKPDGKIELIDAEVSACSYLAHDNSHYSIGAGRMLLTPFEPDSFEHRNGGEVGTGDYSVWLTNGLVRVYGVPLLWLPAFYKPRDQTLGLFSLIIGKSSDWGYYVMMRKRFNFTSYPASSVQLMGDYFSSRGFGYGANGHFKLENSRTEFFAYSIYDNHPYKEGDYHKYRFKIPHSRFNFRVSNVTHITPRLDFRGVFDYTSDYFFTRDFFNERYSSDPQPSTYAALEQSFDAFSVAAYARFRINKSYSTVEKMPEVRIDLHRQQIFNTPLYYQGDLSAAYMRMRWIEFDRGQSKPKPDDGILSRPYADLDDYDAIRLDTTHFIYLPLQKNSFSLIPRAGVKITAYSNSSKQRVTSDDLIKLFNAAKPDSENGAFSLVNYDRKGGSEVRVVGELGAEASFKIHNTWQNARSNLLGIDGLRHVMRPYINYTYISKPNVSRDHLYYFDDIDRIEKENFFRFGLENRLQTRDGDTGVREYFSMENFWDLHLEKSDDSLSNIGNFCTLIEFKPIRNLTISTAFSIDAGGNNDDVPPVKRNGRERNAGLRAKWLNRWELAITYEPVKDFKFKFSYKYNRTYTSRSAYSMGTTLMQLDAGSYFNCYRSTRTETFSFGASMPLTPDRRTFGAFNITYDVLDGGFDTISFMVMRRFHCFEVIGTLNFESDDDASSGWDTNFSIQARLLGLEMPVDNSSNQMLSRANESMGYGGSNSRRMW